MDSPPPFYPPPRIPLSPVLSKISIRNRITEVAPSLLDSKYFIHVTSGRAAIALALQHAGIGKGDSVLVPSYHCESMLSPIRWIGATPVFYRVFSDTLVDIDDIRNKTHSHTKAIIAAHYFGFLQDYSELRKYCDKKRIVFIEDCAHSFFGSIQGKPVGSFGHYAIGSTMKFFPVYDGGCLVSNERNISNISLGIPSFKLQIKSIFNTIERSHLYNRLGLTGNILSIILRVKDVGWSIIKKLSSQNRLSIDSPSSSDGGYDLDPKWIHFRSTYASEYIVNRSDQMQIASRRRSNFKFLLEHLTYVRGCHPLFDNLPDHITPLVFPLYVDNPDACFDKLKKEGVPIWRFGEFLDASINKEVFPDSIELSEHIFQLPCHQELKREEIEWLVKKVSSILRQEKT